MEELEEARRGHCQGSEWSHLRGGVLRAARQRDQLSQSECDHTRREEGDDGRATAQECGQLDEIALVVDILSGDHEATTAATINRQSRYGQVLRRSANNRRTRGPLQKRGQGQERQDLAHQDQKALPANQQELQHDLHERGRASTLREVHEKSRGSHNARGLQDRVSLHHSIAKQVPIQRQRLIKYSDDQSIANIHTYIHIHT